MKLLIMQFCPAAYLSGPNILLNTQFSNTFSLFSFLIVNKKFWEEQIAYFALIQY
jgi:hypothetical protein